MNKDKKKYDNDNEMKKEARPEKMKATCLRCQCCLLDQIQLSNIELERICSG